MLTSTHLLTLIFILASSTMSAVFVKTKGHKCPLIYFLSQDTNWANGIFYNEDGSVAINTKRTGSDISFFENNIRVSSIPASGISCANNLTVQDSHGVKFTPLIDFSHKLYTWSFQRGSGTSFTWKLSYSKDEHRQGHLPITGAVTRGGKTDLVARISVAKPDEPPKVLNRKIAYRIVIANPAAVNDVPDHLEIAELLYLLFIGPKTCTGGRNLIPSNNWPFYPPGGGDQCYVASESECS